MGGGCWWRSTHMLCFALLVYVRALSRTCSIDHQHGMAIDPIPIYETLSAS